LRYLKKILTTAEIEFVAHVDDPDTALWSLWACKETAYKIIKKSDENASFLPRLWTVQPKKTEKKQNEFEVILPGKEAIFISLFPTGNYVHCVGADDLSMLDKIICSVDQLPAVDVEKVISASSFVRERLTERLADYFHLNYRDIEIRREKKEGALYIPCVYYEDKRYPVDISLSHDGWFVAYAFIPSINI
jgi:phosphopantetheinyl transferase (holo-ACP synthase)